jgi:hypothetical protein
MFPRFREGRSTNTDENTVYAGMLLGKGRGLPGKMNMTTHFIYSVCVDVFVCVMCTEYSWKIYKIIKGKRTQLFTFR